MELLLELDMTGHGRTRG